MVKFRKMRPITQNLDYLLIAVTEKGRCGVGIRDEEKMGRVLHTSCWYIAVTTAPGSVDRTCEDHFINEGIICHHHKTNSLLRCINALLITRFVPGICKNLFIQWSILKTQTDMSSSSSGQQGSYRARRHLWGLVEKVPPEKHTIWLTHWGDFTCLVSFLCRVHIHLMPTEWYHQSWRVNGGDANLLRGRIAAIHFFSHPFVTIILQMLH